MPSRATKQIYFWIFTRRRHTLVAQNRPASVRLHHWFVEVNNNKIHEFYSSNNYPLHMIMNLITIVYNSSKVVKTFQLLLDLKTTKHWCESNQRKQKWCPWQSRKKYIGTKSTSWKYSDEECKICLWRLLESIRAPWYWWKNENAKIHFGEFGDRQRQLNLVTPPTLNFWNFVCCYHIICTRSLHGQCLPLVDNIFQSKPSEIRYWKHSFGSDVMIHVYKYWWQWWKWQCGYDVCCSNCS